jgi:hypothetical protein
MAMKEFLDEFFKCHSVTRAPHFCWRAGKSEKAHQAMGLVRRNAVMHIVCMYNMDKV